ncbi:MAG TPA: N-acetylmuramoyl-L-alanine amidase [Anaerolineae bacterium]|nr:N-acetylmuramoyl-L-alanine amidase [Anaerolineae bacterium]
MITCFDAGHGGHDPGAVYHGWVEKDIALTWAKLLARTHDATWGDFGCSSMTRTEDVYPSWDARYHEAEHADALVSVHVNAGGGRGFEAWYHSEAGLALAEQIMALWPGEFRRGVKHDSTSRLGRLSILQDTKPPAVLLELGFIDSPEDMRLLHDLDFALIASQAIIDAVEDWYVNR